MRQLTDLTSLLKVPLSHQEIAQVFRGLASVPPSVLKPVLLGLDSAVIKQLAHWAMLFVTELNRLEIPPSPSQEEPVLTGDFHDAMQAIQPNRISLCSSDLANAMNSMTKAIKANNYLQSVKMGIAIARCLASV